jgi:hypothetical protein
MAILLGPAAIEDRIVRFHKTVEFTVVDAETSAPLSGATVTVAYDGWGGMVPDPVAGVTDEAGRVSLRVVKDRAPGAGASAAHYLPSLDGRLGADPPATVMLRAYREPRPFHVLEVPENARGELRFRLLPYRPPSDEPSARPHWRPGQRGFVTRLVPGGVADMLRLPEMGAQVYDHQAIQAAQRADGSVIPMWFQQRFWGPPPSDEVALWYLGSHMQLERSQTTITTVFVMYMGSLREAAAEQARLQREWETTLVQGLYLLPPLPAEATTASAPPPG